MAMKDFYKITLYTHDLKGDRKSYNKIEKFYTYYTSLLESINFLRRHNYICIGEKIEDKKITTYYYKKNDKASATIEKVKWKL